MRVDWYGQAAFHLSGREGSVFIDPIGDTSRLAGRGIQFDYPPVAGVNADLVLITHEHGDHAGCAFEFAAAHRVAEKRAGPTRRVKRKTRRQQGGE